MNPVFVKLRPALLWADLPDGHVLLDDGGDEVVEAWNGRSTDVVSIL